jgi:hypothetical protein
MIGVWVLWANAAFAGTTRVTSADQSRVFSGTISTIEVRFQNSADSMFESDVFMRIFQFSSATALPVTTRERWNSLKVLAHQTIVEQVKLELPNVRAKTRFEIHWSDANGAALGTTAIEAYPTNLLMKFTEFCVGGQLGIFDPESRLTPLFAAAGVEFEDLGQSTFDHFHGRLIVAFVDDAAQEARLLKSVRRGVNAVMISAKAEELSSGDFIIVNENSDTRRVLVHPNTVANLKSDVDSQLRLISIARLVTNTNHQNLIIPP